MASGRVRILSGGVRNVKNISEEGTRDAKKGRGTALRLPFDSAQGARSGSGTRDELLTEKKCSSDSDKETRRRGDKGIADYGLRIVDCGLPTVSSLRSVADLKILSWQGKFGLKKMLIYIIPYPQPQP